MAWAVHWQNSHLRFRSREAEQRQVGWRGVMMSPHCTAPDLAGVVRTNEKYEDGFRDGQERVCQTMFSGGRGSKNPGLISQSGGCFGFQSAGGKDFCDDLP